MRRGLGRGRLLIGIGAVLALVGAPLPWYTVGGEVLPAVTSSGLQGAGILVFLAAVGMLAVILLPYASGTGRASLDRPIVYLALLGVGVLGLALEAMESVAAGRLGLPDRALGLWFAAGGMLVAGWGVAELFMGRGDRR